MENWSHGTITFWILDFRFRIDIFDLKIIAFRNPQSQIRNRITPILRQHAAKKAEEIIEAVITAVNRFQDESEVEDDITLIVIKKERRIKK